MIVDLGQEIEDVLDREYSWEFFCDESYYGLWAVRRIGDKDFNSKGLFYVQSEEEAIALVERLNRVVL